MQPAHKVVNCLVGVVWAPADVDDFDVLFAVVAWPVAPGARTRARVVGLEAHAAAGRTAAGTEAIGFLKLAV